MISPLNYSPIIALQNKNKTYRTRPQGGDVVSFSGRVDLVKDIEFVKKLVGQCEYGKDLKWLLSPESDFGVICETKEDAVLIKNFFPPEKSILKNKKETCGPLSYVVGKELNKKLGDKHLFKLGKGPYEKFFPKEVGGNHIILVMHPYKNPDNKLIIDPSFNNIGTLKELPNYDIEHEFSL